MVIKVVVSLNTISSVYSLLRLQITFLFQCFDKLPVMLAHTTVFENAITVMLLNLT